MKLGYSNLLGEYVEATSINHTDCEQFQIVCPACREPVFKVEREARETIHYLSHYKKDLAYSEECELRVASIARAEVDNVLSFARGQRLQYFLKVLREDILKEDYGMFEVLGGSRKRMNYMLNSKSMQILRDNEYNHLRKCILKEDDAEIRNGIRFAVNEFELNVRNFPKTSFGKSKQIEIAADIYRHLLSGNSKKNFDFVYCYAFDMLGAWLKEYVRSRNPDAWIIDLYKAMLLIPSLPRIKARELFSILDNYPCPDQEGETVLGYMQECVRVQMYLCLAMRRYFELLKERRGRK